MKPAKVGVLLLFLAATHYGVFVCGTSFQETTDRPDLALAIVHKGQPWPAQHITSDPPGAVFAGNDFSIMLHPDGEVYIKPLARISEPCGYPDPLDPSPENHYIPCPYLLDVDRAAAILRANMVVYLGAAHYESVVSVRSGWVN